MQHQNSQPIRLATIGTNVIVDKFLDAIKALEAKKHVLCEKPICSNIKELESNLTLAATQEVVLLEAMRPLYTPETHIIKQALQELGSLRLVNLNYCQYSSRYDKFKQGIVENAFKPELSNGALMDIGVYCIAFMAELFDKPKSIQAIGQMIPNSIDGCGYIVATYQEMQVGLTYSKVSDSSALCEIQGEKGTLYFDRVACPQKVWIDYRNGEHEVLVDHEETNDMVYELEVFREMVKGERTVQKAIETSKIIMEVLDEARRQIGIVFPADDVDL